MSLALTQRNRTPLFFAVMLFGALVLIPVLRLIGIPGILLHEHLGWVGNLLLIYTVLNSGKARPSIQLYAIYTFLFFTLYMAYIGLNNKDVMMMYYWGEFSCYMRFFLMMVLGYKWVEFNNIKKAMMILLVVGIVVNLGSIITTGTFLRNLLEEKTLTYKLQYILMPSAFYLFMYDRLNKHERIIVLTAFAVYALEQILFQKRLPTARVLITLGLFFVANATFARGTNKAGLVFKRLMTFVVGFSVGALLLSIVGFNITTYVTALVDRFYTESTITETVEEDARWKIGERFYDNLKSSGDYYSGRGFGSVIFDPTFEMADAQGREFRTAAEMGFPTMVLKGGVGLVYYFSFLFFLLLMRFKLARKHRFSFACWCFAFIWLIFVYSEGFIGNVFSINEVFAAYTIGCVLARPEILRANAQYYERYSS